MENRGDHRRFLCSTLYPEILAEKIFTLVLSKIILKIPSCDDENKNDLNYLFVKKSVSVLYFTTYLEETNNERDPKCEYSCSLVIFQF